MSHLTNLINQLCPDGVEYRKLWSVTVWDKKFNSVERQKQPKTINYHYYLASELRRLAVAGGDVKLLSTGGENYGYTTDEIAGDNLSIGEIVCIPWGGKAFVQYYNGKFLTSDNRIATSFDKSILDNKYLYYFMVNSLPLIESFYRGSGIKHPSMAKVLNLEIPIPPLPIQAEIVRILDSFTELQTELQTELTLRQKQYEYYRNQLLTFDPDDPAVEWITISNLCDIRNGYTPSKSNEAYWSGIDATIPWFRMDDIRANGHILSDSLQHITPAAVKGKLFPANSIILATTATIGEHALITADSLANQQFTYLTIREPHKSLVDPKYFYYYMYKVDEWCKSHVKQSSFPAVDMTALRKLEIPIPPLTEQQRIVNILDKFSDYTTSLTNGLPAEIKLRQQQYEYYRDKLLSFRRASAA